MKDLEIFLGGFSGLAESAREGNIFPYVVCGVDVYRSPEAAIEDRTEIEISKPLSASLTDTAGLHFTAINTGLFFSGRHYRIVHLLDLEEYDSCSDIAEVKERIKKLRVEGSGLLKGSYLESLDTDCAYVLTPLNEGELEELMKE